MQIMQAIVYPDSKHLRILAQVLDASCMGGINEHRIGECDCAPENFASARLFSFLDLTDEINYIFRVNVKQE
jgi:hypothetical protein